MWPDALAWWKIIFDANMKFLLMKFTNMQIFPPEKCRDFDEIHVYRICTTDTDTHAHTHQYSTL